MTTPNASIDDTGDEINRWVDLLMVDHTPQERACLDAAWKIADAASVEPASATPPGSYIVREAVWCRVAVSAYQRLLESGAYAHLAPPPACSADPDPIRAWLASPSRDPGFEGHTVADVWDFNDESKDVERYLTNLVDQAQSAGVWGIPGHTIAVWHLAGADRYRDGHLVTIDTTTGAPYASDHLASSDLVAPDLTGTGAAVDALTALATTVDAVMAQARHGTDTVASVAAADQVRSTTANPFPTNPLMRPQTTAPTQHARSSTTPTRPGPVNRPATR